MELWYNPINFCYGHNHFLVPTSGIGRLPVRNLGGASLEEWRQKGGVVEFSHI